MSYPLNENELLAQHAQTAYNLALRLTGNPADAEDLAQDALLRALKALPGFRGESQVSTWLYRITVNTWKNRVRAEKRRGFWKTVSLNLFTGEDHDEEPAFKADDPPLDAGLATEESAGAVQKALLELDGEFRAAVILRDIEGRSYEEIASVLEVPPGTVKSRISRGREELKALLKKHAAAG